MCYADKVLAPGAAIINLPIRATPLLRRLEPQGAV